MDETDRKDFKMTSEDMTKLLAAMQPDPMIALQCGSGPTLQERANAAWKELGERMGFEHMSVRAPLKGFDPHVFSAIPLDIITPIEKVADALRMDSKNMIVGTVLVPEQCLELYMNNGEEDVWYQVTVTKVELDGE